MKEQAMSTMGLVIRSGAYDKRSARSQLDIALVFAALDMPIRLYFLGSSVMQLVAERQLSGALLPAGYRAWASLTELTNVEWMCEPGWLRNLQEKSLELSMPVKAMSVQKMSIDWSECDKVIVL